MEPTTDQRDPTAGGRRPPRGPRLGDSRAPVTTVVVLAAAVVAVIVGLVLLRSITDDSRTAEPDITAAPRTSVAVTVVAMPELATTTAPTTTIGPTAAKGDAAVLVVNASG